MTPYRGETTAGTSIVGVVGHDLSAPSFVDFAEGLRHRIQEAGRILLLASAEGDARQLSEVLESLWSLHAEGVIVFGDIGWRARLAQFACHGPPVVVVGDCVEASNVACVGFDSEAAARLAVEHLAGTGRRRIGMIGLRDLPPGQSPSEQDFLAAAEAAGVHVATVRAEATVEGGGAGLRALLERFRGMDGVLAHNDLMATGAIRAAIARGIRVPGDIAVVGADDTGISALVAPALTTVRFDRNRLVEAVTDALDQLIGTPGQRPETVVVPVELVVRESA